MRFGLRLYHGLSFIMGVVGGDIELRIICRWFIYESLLKII